MSKGKYPKKIFYVRIDLIDLFDFATDSIGEKMSLLDFAKELKKEKSEIPQIQRIINEAHCFMDQKVLAGKESARKRKEERERIKKEQEKVNAVGTVVNAVPTVVNAPPTNNSNSNNLKDKPPTQEKSYSVNHDNGEIFYPVGWDNGEDECPFDEVQQ